MTTMCPSLQSATEGASRGGNAAGDGRELHCEGLPGAVVVISDKGTIMAANDAVEGVFGFSRREMCGRNISMLMPTAERDAHDFFLSTYLRTGERHVIGYGRVVRGRRKDGSTFLMELNVEEKMSIAGTRSFVGLIRDLSSHSRIETELQQAHRLDAVRRLTTGIAHRFNNLLAAISGNLESLEVRLPGEDVQTLLRDARSAADDGARLTAQLLAFSRRQAINPSSVDVALVVSDCLPRLNLLVPTNTEIRMVVTGATLLANVDGVLLQSCLDQLVANAGEAMGPGGHLTIDLSRVHLDAEEVRVYPEVRSGEFIAITVSDDGSGMSEETRAYAFEPFFSTHTLVGDRGLGLSSVYGFIKQSGGHIELESALGVGTTVRLYLPAASSTVGVI